MITKLANWIGMIGIALFYPLQDWQMLRTGETTGLSLLAFSSLLIGVIGFSVLGWKVKNYQLMAANVVATVFCVLTLFLMTT